MHVERNFLAVRRPRLVAEAIEVFAVRLGCEGVLVGGDGVFGILSASGGAINLRRIIDISTDSIYSVYFLSCRNRVYPEINVQIPAPAKLPIASLKRHRHLVPLVQVLVEALARVSPQQDVVRGRGADEAQRGC